MNDTETCIYPKYPEKNFDTLQVGGSYLSRGGETVVIAEHEPGWRYPFVDRNDDSYLSTGRYYDALESSLDLIELIPKPSTTIPETGMTDIDRCAPRNTDNPSNQYKASWDTPEYWAEQEARNQLATDRPRDIAKQSDFDDINCDLAMLYKNLRAIGETGWAETCKKAANEITQLRESK